MNNVTTTKNVRTFRKLEDLNLIDNFLFQQMLMQHDPFDQNRMVYTIRNHCDEVPDLTYDDGARKIYLYTGGIEGNPSQSLKSMLKYIQKSTKENVTYEDIASIEQLVNKVKHKMLHTANNY